MLFTIAIPTYNNASVLHKAILSAINQKIDDDYEILIVNNASTDNTLKVIENFKTNSIRVITNEQTVPLFENHNVCIRHAKGEYVLFCHSDDELLPNALSILKEHIIKRGNPKKYIVWGHSLFRDYSIQLRKCDQPLNEMFSGEVALQVFITGVGVAPSGVCYSRESILEFGAFPYSKYRLMEGDWYILIISLFNCFEFEMIDRLFLKRQFASTAVSNLKISDWKEARHDTIKLILEKLSSNHKKMFLDGMYLYSSVVFFPHIKKMLSLKQKIIYLTRRLPELIKYRSELYSIIFG